MWVFSIISQNKPNGNVSCQRPNAISIHKRQNNNKFNENMQREMISFKLKSKCLMGFVSRKKNRCCKQQKSRWMKMNVLRVFWLLLLLVEYCAFALVVPLMLLSGGFVFHVCSSFLLPTSTIKANQNKTFLSVFHCSSLNLVRSTTKTIYFLVILWSFEGKKNSKQNESFPGKLK